MTAPPDKLLRRKAVLRVGAASWCFGTAFLRSRFAQSWPLKRDGQPHRTRRIRAGAAGVILDCACAPILTGTAGGTSAKPSPLPRTPEKGCCARRFRFEPAYRNTLCLRRRLETNL